MKNAATVKYAVLTLALLLAASAVISVLLIVRKDPPVSAETSGSTVAGSTTAGSDTDAPHEAVESGVLKVSVSYRDGEHVVFSTAAPSLSSLSLEEGAVSLTVQNGLPESAGVVLLIESGGALFWHELTFEDGYASMPLDGIPAGSVISPVRNENGTETFYAASGLAFSEALARSAGVVSMAGDIILPDADTVIEAPFVWETNGFSFTTNGELHFISDTAGKMEIKNSDTDIRCGGIFCDAPLWDFTVISPFGAFLEERAYYIYAKSVNGRTVDCGEVYVDSEDDWKSLTESGRLEIRPGVQRVVCEGELSLTGTVIDRAVSLVLYGNVGIAGSITFETDLDGAITIDSTENRIPLGDLIHFEAPRADVIWQGDDAPGFDHVEERMNVLSYNGVLTDAHMGGDGDSLLASGIIRDSVSGVTAAFTPDGNVIDLALGYADTFDPAAAEISAELSAGGSCELACENGSWYCIVTDAQGKTRGYKLNIFRADYMLPVIRITTDGGRITTESYIGGTFSIDYNGAYDLDSITDASIKIRGRGHSSWKLDKKPYKIKFESGTSLFGLEKAKRWVLIANHVDRSLIRNKLAYSIGELLDRLVFVPGAFMADVFVDGKYQGVYQVSEQIEVNEGRVPGEEDSTETDTDYLLEIGEDPVKVSFGTNNFTHTLFRFVGIKNPDEDILTEEQYRYISGYVKSVEDAVISGGDYESLLDVPSLVDWFLLYEFSYNLDGIFRRSDFLLKMKGDKLYFCTPWDFDYAFGNMGLDSDDYHEWICLGNSRTDAYDEYIKTNIMDYLLSDPGFISQLKSRWDEVGEAILARGLETVDRAEDEMIPSANENFRRWDIMGKKIQFEKRATVNIKSYEGQLDYLREFMKSRFEWMDKTIRGM